MAEKSLFTDTFDACIKCSNIYNRIRPALCQCKHCSNPFCFECMKDHNDDLQQNIEQVSNRYNELKDLLNKKRKLVTDETIKSKQQMSEWLRKYIDNLTIEKAKIDADIDKAEKEAEEFVHNIEKQLNICSAGIENFIKSTIFQSEQMEQLLSKLDELIQQLSPLAATRDYDLPATMPKYKFQFNYSSQPTKDDTQRTLTASRIQDHEDSKTTEQLKIGEQNQLDSFASDTKSSWSEASSTPLPDENYLCNRNRYEPTSYTVNCMASDGINIMYSNIDDPQHDLIAYCYLDVNDVNYGQADPKRPWLLSPIIDMIWWKSIDKFVCATENRILTVEYVNKRFKILTTINDRWTNPRIAANTKNIWVHVKDKIMIYDINFKLVRSINFNIPCIITRESFCVTDNLVAFLVIRGDRTRSDILQIQFYDINMIKMRVFDVGSGTAPCMVRTDNTDCFYMVDGNQIFYVRSLKGYKQAILLGKEANCLAVVNSRNIVFTKSRSDLELIKL